MHQHDKKHRLAELEEKSSQQQTVQPQASQPNTQFILPKQDNAESVDPNAATVKSAGTFYPVSAIPKVEVSTTIAQPGLPVLGMRAAPISSSHIILNSTAGPVLLNSTAGPVVAQIPVVQNIGPIAVPMAILPAQGASVASSGLVPLLQVKGTTTPQLHWTEFIKKMHYGIDQNCGRPFCKLKKKDHLHCYECNQAMSDPERLKIHVSTKHGLRLDQAEMVLGKPVAKVPPNVASVPQMAQGFNGEGNNSEESEEERMYGEEEQEGAEENEENNMRPELLSDSPQKDQSTGKPTDGCTEKHESRSSFDSEDEPLMNLSIRSEEDSMPCNTQSKDLALTDSLSESNEDTPGLVGEAISRRSGRKRTATKHADFVDSDEAVNKTRKLSSTARQVKGETVAEGYDKFKYYEDCHIEKCSYRLNASHYHCVRKECKYGFSDRLRILTHNQKHERMDSVMGEDFLQFRVNQDCLRQDCDHSSKYSHFHCLRCPFVCTDANKVLAHRRQHNKTDSITAQGFQKFTGTTDCFISTCNYYRKQTHYHCTVPDCNVAVLGPSQMGVHRQKHMTGVVTGVEGQVSSHITPVNVTQA